MTGTIKHINAEKLYAFIKGSNGVEYFMHHSALKNCSFSELQQGTEVEFEDEEGTRGPRAADVFVVAV